jgi:Flp pilus assembly pilin Flp
VQRRTAQQEVTSLATLNTAIVRLRLGLSRENAQTMAEYAVILAVVTVIVIAAIMTLSGEIGNALDKVTDVLKGSGDSGGTTP